MKTAMAVPLWHRQLDNRNKKSAWFCGLRVYNTAGECALGRFFRPGSGELKESVVQFDSGTYIVEQRWIVPTRPNWSGENGTDRRLIVFGSFITVRKTKGYWID